MSGNQRMIPGGIEMEQSPKMGLLIHFQHKNKKWTLRLNKHDVDEGIAKYAWIIQFPWFLYKDQFNSPSFRYGENISTQSKTILLINNFSREPWPKSSQKVSSFHSRKYFSFICFIFFTKSSRFTHIETSPFIYTANYWTCTYIETAFVLNVLNQCAFRLSSRISEREYGTIISLCHVTSINVMKTCQAFVKVGWTKTLSSLLRIIHLVSTQNFPKNYHFLPCNTHTYVRASGGKKC